MATNFYDIPDRLWKAADKLRTNTYLHSSEYFISLLNLIFLKFADQQFDRVDRELRTEQFKLEPSSYKARGAIYLPPEARFDYLLGLSGRGYIGEAISYAMQLIEQYNEDLRDVLSIDNFSQIDDRTLVYILNDVATILSGAGKGENTFGQIYEYFLDKIALKEGSKGGEFFTPASINRLLVEVMKPNRGSILDPACGVGGIFVQSMRLTQDQHSNPSTAISLFGQEITTETVSLCKMNLAIHGLSGDIRRANSYYEDPHSSFGRFDFVISNPPFNAKGIDKHRLLSQGYRFPFGIPRTDNANYLWIQMFYSALNDTGRAGFIMPNSACDAQASEKEIRRKMISSGVVDVIVAVGSNFFYTMTLPCTLWFFDKGKRQIERRDKILFIDAQQFYKQIDHTHRNFTNDQLEFIANIVRLYRGETVETSNGSAARLTENFPGGKYIDVPELCKVATLAEIEAQDWSLSPRRYIRERKSVTAPAVNRTKVFISYCHRDIKDLERLHIHLAFKERELDLWDDTRISPGEMWREEIKEALSCTKVAILLISADFLASKFIEEDELPPLLKAAKKEEALILPVILGPCAFRDSQLADFQSVNDPLRPLIGMNRYNKEKVWDEVAKRVRDIMHSKS